MPDESDALSTEEIAQIVANVKVLAPSVDFRNGPDDSHIFKGVQGFVLAFNFRYSRVISATVPKYRNNIVARINPLIRKFQLEGMTSSQVAHQLVEDWAARNFVTAGGFAIEELAIGVSVDAQKSATEGIDIQRFDPDTGIYHLYVLKSGIVTRNSDILAALKRNARQAERVLRAGHTVLGVTSNYAIAAGKTSETTFEDGVRRPSSDVFWSEMTGLQPEAAVELVLAMAAEAGRLVRSDAAVPLESMKLLVREYIRSDADPDEVDWAWIAKRTMQPRSAWRAEDRRRHAAALKALQGLRSGELEEGDLGDENTGDGLSEDGQHD